MKHKLATILLLIAFLAIITAGCGQKKTTVVWTAPTYGSEVHHYVLVIEGGGETQSFTTTETKYTLKLAKGYTFYAAVAGVNAIGEMGPFSETSDPFEIN